MQRAPGGEGGLRGVLIALALLTLSACGPASPDGAAVNGAAGVQVASDLEPGLWDTVSARCALLPDPVLVWQEEGNVQKVWTFPLAPVHGAPVLPDEPGLLAYRAAIRSRGAVEKHPALQLPPPQDEAEAEIWRDEEFNNALVYGGEVGAIEPITCLDALLFAEQNARMAQLEHPTEFLASVLVRESGGTTEVTVIFGAGMEFFPPMSVYGAEIVERYVAEGWRYRYFLHNHTIQADGSLGVPVPSTSDVRFARSLATNRGLERIRVTNGFFTFDAPARELEMMRGR